LGGCFSFFLLLLLAPLLYFGGLYVASCWGLVLLLAVGLLAVISGRIMQLKEVINFLKVALLRTTPERLLFFGLK
jgi:hypothetical protein